MNKKSFLYKILNNILIIDISKYFMQNKKYFVLGFIFLILAGFTQLSIPILFSKKLDLISNSKDINTYVNSFLLLCILLCGQLILNLIKDSSTKCTK